MTGNVTGHFTVPSLRELLTPLTQQVEEEIQKEEEPIRRKQRKVLDTSPTQRQGWGKVGVR